MRILRSLAFAAAVCSLAACGSSPTLPAAAPAGIHHDLGGTTGTGTDIAGTMGSGNDTATSPDAVSPTTTTLEIAGTMGSGN